MDPRAVAMRWPEPRLRMIAELAMVVTEAPWRLSRETRARAAAVGLDDELVIHAVALSAYFGHLNRVADAVGVPLDYVVKHPVHAAVPTTPRYEPAPHVVAAGELGIERRPATAAAIATWRDYVMLRDAPLSREQRAGIAARVLGLVGAAVPSSGGDAALEALADVVTLAPWALGPEAFAALRARGADDARVFDAVVVASTTGMIGRIAVALGALSEP